MRVTHIPHDGVPVDDDGQPLPRHLACAHCGHGFTVEEGEAALQQKRQLQADGGVPANENAARDDTRDAFRELARNMTNAGWPR